MERGLLSDNALSEYYDDVAWMYLFQDFSASEADRAAQRVAIRFGITAWPQHMLIDPYTMEVIASTGRNLKSFAAAVSAAKARICEPEEPEKSPFTPAKLKAADDAAALLEIRLLEARRDLTHQDTVVRYRALELLQLAEPSTVVKKAAELLKTPHDQTRFLTCQLLAKHGYPSLSDVRTALHEIVKEPKDSRNPNVLRINAVKALVKCGNASSIEVVAPHAISGVYFNGLTGISIDVLIGLATDAKRKRQIFDSLVMGFPEVPKTKPGEKYAERTMRACTALAKRVHKALSEVSGSEIAFPEAYTEESREALIEAWTQKK